MDYLKPEFRLLTQAARCWGIGTESARRLYAHRLRAIGHIGPVCIYSATDVDEIRKERLSRGLAVGPEVVQ